MTDRWVVLLRGVNVGGHNKLKMAEFREALCGAGFEDVETYIQSGNAVLGGGGSALDVSGRVAEVLKTSFGIEVPVLALPADTLSRLVDNTPFEGEASHVMLYFCFEPLDADFDDAPLQSLTLPDDELAVAPDVIYFHAPDGIGRSKLAGKMDRLVPVQLTARNIRTARKLLDLARSPS